MHEGDKQTAGDGNTANASAQNNAPERAGSESERIKELRERLYSRGSAPTQTIRHGIPPRAIHETMASKEESEASRVEPPRKSVVETPVVPEVVKPEPAPENTVLYSKPMVSQKRKSLRKKIAIVGGAFFVVAVVISSLILFSGNNTISGENITLTATGPIAVGGGEILPFTVSVANQNTVPIQSATLIIEYPKGTQSATENNREINVERKQLDVVEAGQLVNVELSARIFGEENDAKEIKVSIDYRVAGSNATFHKEANPLQFKVSTSPIVMTIDAVKSISSGQEIELTFTVQSNAPSPLSDILIKASYPEGFDFSEAEPDTVSGEDTWKIATLKPAEKYTVTVRGLITGYEDDVRTFSAMAGVAGTTDRNTLASVLANAQAVVSIEQPFLEVGVAINGSTNESAVIDTDDVAVVEVTYKNALDTAIYDGKIFVELEGNALDEFEVKSTSGFYDSTKNTLSWDAVDEESLKEILPGRTSNVSFTLTPKDDIGRAPEMNLKVTVRGNRRFENNVPEELVGTALRSIKVESVPTMQTAVIYGSGPFTNTGPVPPVAEKMTQYTYALSVETGTNDITGAEVTAIVPSYIKWLDLVSNGDNVTYNASTRTLKWTIGDMDANDEETVAIQVSFIPSLSQVGTTPTILEVQRFRATDRFTGTVVRAEHPAVTTSLLYEEDEDLRDGRVERD